MTKPLFFGDDASELHRVYDGEYVYCVPRVLYHYRRRGGQMTEVLFPPRRLDDLKMYWNWLGWFAAQPDKTEYKGYYEWAVAWYWKVFYLFWCQASEAG
ncbi:capsular polysaccharide biosynthesis protein CpsI, partial [human gut metagenome]